MIQKIELQINVINDALSWIKRNKPEHYEQRFMQLVEERRKLRKLALAEKENPAIAAYGKSQAGKSYLMSNILQKDGQPFLVTIDGKSYNFINEMNPITNNTEATGVVTRFSSFKRNADRFSERFPIMMKALSVADITLVLCDGYFNDLGDYTVPSGSEINELADNLYEKYKNMPEQATSPMTEDDVFDMKDYFRKYINNAQAFYSKDSNFFERIALIIRKVPVSDYPAIFSHLWSNESHLSQLFVRLLQIMRKLNFASEVYLPVEAVLHHGVNENTIMSVQCLNGLADNSQPRYTEAYLRNGDNYTKVENLQKSEMSAICAEVVFKIEKDFLESSSTYDFEMITDPASAQSITHTPVQKAILKSTDLLDFPGARSRKKESVTTLEEGKILTTVLLRGKVAYLFNKYSESRVVNVLLFCQDYAQNDVTDLFSTLNKWVNTYVGKTPGERQRTLQICSGISPLFYVGTKFNVDMQEDQNAAANEREAIDGRWFARFQKVLYGECFNADGVEWVKNWTQTGEFFKNSYLLRDFKYSGEKTSKLYFGFATEGREQKLTIPKPFYDTLRRSFIESKEVRMFFENPAKSWDVATTINNDGALYIIENLSVVADCLSKARDAQFAQQLDETRTKVLDVLEQYHVSEDTDEILQENIRKANAIIREMDFTCNEDNYFFGHLLQALQISETSCLQIVHQLINNGELGEKNNNFSDYEIVLKHCRNFDGCETFDDCWNRLQLFYGFRKQEEAEKYLAGRGVDYKQLFSKTFKKKLNSCVIADRVFAMWQKNIKSVEFMNQILANQRFDSVVMSTLLDGITDTSNYLKLNDLMAEAIAEHVNVIAVKAINESLVADIMASTINSYVTDLGYALLTDADRQNARKVVEQYQLPVYEYIDKDRKSHFEESELTALFDDLTDNPKAMTLSFENNYYTWLEYIYVSFIAHLDVPEYDKEANRQLSEIINTIA
ncbi:MAG: putative virulence factor [Prevotella sp.]|nr:putative virulence factor [Prevotella sp.]